MLNRIKHLISRVLEKTAPVTVVRAQITTLAQNELLKDRKALITGGTSGIGFQIARSFLNSGCEIVITGRNQAKINSVCFQLEQENPEWKDRVHGVEMDVTKVDELDDKFDVVLQKMGGLDILVNNAGVEGGHINWCKEEDFDAIVNTNMKGVFFLSRIAGRYMIRNHISGNILNVCSSSSLRPANSVYTMSKWAVRSLTEGLARMLIPHQIVVNGIAPGMTATPMLQKQDSTDNLSRPDTLVGRYATAEEIANMAVIMVSGMCRMVVGDVLYMTGGSGLLYNEDMNYTFQ